jgi:nucleoside-diphosphate-sugar epimerase
LQEFILDGGKKMLINGSNVAVVGGCGFLGSHLVEYLIEERGCKVLAIDNLIVGRRDFLHRLAQFEWCDISISETQIQRILKAYKIDYVFNYAAMPYVPVSYERPLMVFDVNARGALMLINAAQEVGVKGVLQVSSAEIYGDAIGRITEDHPARPHSSYGASKLAIDALVQTRWREAQTPVISLRQFNCCGERDVLHPYVIPEIIMQLQKGETVRLGNNTFRDFIYAKDAVAMAVELLEHGQCGQVYNLGSECGIKIYDLALLIAKIMGKPISIVEDPARKRPWDINHLQSNNAKIYDVVSLRPCTPLKIALERTISSFEGVK